MAAEKKGTAVSVATLIIVCLVFFTDIANLGMANIALPTIKKELGYDEATLQWILTAYALTFGGFLMAGGRLGDIFGHRNVLVCGMSLFNVSCIVCAVVHDKIGLIVGRAFQGLGAALAIPPAQSLVSLSFQDPQARVKAFALWGAAGSTGFVFGPIVGGLFTSLVSWEWIFWFSLIVEGSLEISALALLLSNNLPGAPPATENGESRWSGLPIKLDIVGTALSVPGVILFVYALTTGNIHGWDKPDVITTLVLSVLLIAAFVFVEVKVVSQPILPKYVWGDRTRMLGCVAGTLTYALWQGINFLLTLQLQSFGFSPLGTALRFLPLGITAMVGNFVAPPLLKYVGARNMMLASWPIGLGGMILLERMSSGEDYWRLCLPGMVLYIAGINTIYFLGNVTVVATATEKLQGTVSGVYNMFINVGGAVLGLAVLTVIRDSVTANEGGEEKASALLAGFRAGYYASMAMCILGFALSVWFFLSQKPEEDQKNESTDETLANSTSNSTHEKLGAAP